ncbi:non-ribosomal peptide synthetase/MFS transporter [Streptomyces sp. TLI_171]|uniref:non-ribosomal peptide synthetase/MFS transporter n=1 Tax=Streptomyces sp. TLI_171 TaxID=1938859 RepID=UPI000C182151|nr:non-ribosomal peptide synthetase/MFS transporter [Streptomyces sp. TLI_171]RKE21815.1 amino acid adenylation domain-containing protein [Streptomyces sp. TLI_171]
MTTTPADPRARLSAETRAELLARRLHRARTAAPAATVPRRPEGAEPPLSFAQERLWFMDQFVPDSTAYTVPLVVRLRGPLDPARLDASLARLVARHESLRMRFPAAADGTPTVVVDPPGGVRLAVRTADPALAPADREEQLDRWVREETARPFDLAAGPVVRAALLRAAEQDHVLVVVQHHIVSDGWSAELLLRELLAGLASDREEPELPLRYGDFAAWQRERYRDGVRRADLEHWRARLAGVPPLDLPADRPRPAVPTLRGAGHGLALDAGSSRAVLALGAAHGATPYMTLLAAYQALLGRWCGQSDFAVGSTVAGRTLPELEPLVGLFANVLALRADLSGDPGFTGLLAGVRDRFVADLAHQEMPFEQLVEELALPRDPSRTPVFQTSFTLLNYARAEQDAADDGPTVGHHPFTTAATRFDLELYLRHTEDGLHGYFTYSSDLFEAGTVARLADLFQRLLRQIVEHPELPISQLDLTDPQEQRVALEEWNDTALELAPGTLHGRFEERAARTPDAVCLTVDATGESLTYRQLDSMAAGLADRLAAVGVGPGSVVAVCAERSAELVAALLGVLKAGGAYLPLDPDHPAERLAGLLAEAEPRALLVQDALRDRLPSELPYGLRTFGLDDPELWRPPAEADRHPLRPAGPDDPAYLIFTSGSTGRPKGVLCSHRGIDNRLDWMQRSYPLGPADAVLQKTPAAFDVSVWELFWPLREGARLVMARPGGHRDGGYLRDAIRRHAVTTVHFVPSMLAVFLAEDGVEQCTDLRTLVCSGEELPADLARQALSRLPGCALHNLYGPTEASVDCTAWTCTRENLAGVRRTPIGRPIQNMRVYVLDRHGRPVPTGLPGELHIAGPGVALGYLGRPELTAERFRDDPWGPPGARMYASGDLARHRPDGTVEYLGRTDQQIKLHGLRIEPGEIEAALRALPGVREAAVAVREDRPGIRRLVAWTVPDGSGADTAPAALREGLRRTLPDSMLPSAYVALDALPVGATGKLDRAALPSPAPAAAGADRTEPATETERAVAGIWAEVLGVPLPGRDEDFFDLGGHSLLGIKVVARLRAALPDAAGLSLMDLFKNPTVRALAALAATPAAERAPARVLHELTARQQADPVLTLVCVPYGGGSAAVYQPLADALPPGHALLALAGTGEEMGRAEGRADFPELVAAAVAEIREHVRGPVAVYGHCGVGGALAVALALALEADGRAVEAVYTGAIFPFARPRGPVVRLLTRMERLTGDRRYRNWLTSLGAGLEEVDPATARRLVRAMRADSEQAEEYFTDLLTRGVTPLRAPVVSVVGERDDITDYHQERFREWHFVTGTTALVVLAEAGHYFLKYRAAEVAEILTTVHPALAAEAPPAEAPPAEVRPAPERTWRLADVSRSPAAPASAVGRRRAPAPGMPRFLAVAAGQLVSMAGTATTEFALPLWLYLSSDSLLQLALLSSLALLPGLLAAPLAGTVADRYSRRAVMLTADTAAGATQAAMLALLVSGELPRPAVYGLMTVLSVALTFQRIAYSSAVPQLVPKRYLGHANGLVQAGAGVVQFAVPLLATAALATVGLRGILIADVASYAVAIAVTAALRFPRTLGWRRRESVGAELRAGFRLALGTPGFRAMLFFFAGTNLLVGPLFIFFQPLVLGFGSLGDVARVSLAGGAGIALGGALMAVWGGPAEHRMRAVLGAFLLMTAGCLVTGLRPSTALVGVGVFGMFLGLTVMNTVYATIVQVKVPARFHGRAFAVNAVFAWCTMPIGFVLLGPGAAALLQPTLEPGGALASTVGRVVGTGAGRGLGLTYVLFALVLIGGCLVVRRLPVFAEFDRRVPDARPDDLVGLEALRERAVGGE